MPDYSTAFSDLTGWTVTGTAALSSEGFTSTETSLLILAKDGEQNLVCRSDIANPHLNDRWYYVSFAIYVPAWSDIWDGGNGWTPYVFDFGSSALLCAAAPSAGSNNAYLVADDATTGHLELNWFAGTFAASLDIPDGEWAAIELALRHDTGGLMQAQWWVNGATAGITSKVLSGNRSPRYVAFGDDGSFVPVVGIPYYIDDFSYDSNARIGPVDLSDACFGAECSSGTQPPFVPGAAGPIIIGAEWRFIVTNLAGETLTLLDRQAYGKQVVAKLNGPWSSTGRVLSESPEINILSPNPYVPSLPQQPFLNEGSRLLYGFRREGRLDSTDDIWKCRFGGIILSTVDDSQSNPATTEYTAYDPWQYLYSLPIVNPVTFEYPPADGLLLAARPGSTMALRALYAAFQSFDDFGVAHIDMPTTFDGFVLGGTGFWGGEVEVTETIGPFRIEQGKSVGEFWDDLVATGTMDIVLRPVYDPINRPGVTSEISIYSRAGVFRPGAVMAWDKPGRSLVGVNRLVDGTQRANIVRFSRGQGGPVDVLVDDPDSQNTYWDYQIQQWFPDKASVGQVVGIGEAQLEDRKDGQQTITVSPASERSASPLLEYEPGDGVPVYSSSAMREALSGAFRVHEIPIDISDNGTESVRSMLVTVEEILSS